MVSTNKIKRLSLEHCAKVLQNNPIEKEFEQWVQIESDMHEYVMKDDNDKDDLIEREEFDEVISNK